MSNDNNTTKNVTAGDHGVAVGGDVHGNVSVSNIIAPTINFLHQLPAPPRDFVGREKELKAILGDMDRGVTISGLQGQGGVGKTALALVVAQKLLPRYPDAQFFIDLQGVTQPIKTVDAMSQIVRAYHPEARLPDDEKQIHNLYLGVLNNQRALLVLDNAKDKEQVLPLLPPASCCLIVTSREHFTLPGLQAKNIEVMSPDDARDLLTTIAPRITQYEIRNTNDLASLCAYLPLALRAAASTLAETPDLDPQKFVEQLRDEKARLSLTAETANNEMISVEASLNLSYARLSEHAQRVFCALSVFPADFDSRAAEAVGEDEEHKGLSELVKRSLVSYNNEAKRYKLHDLSRLFASHRLPDVERYAAQLRHAKHYLEVLRTANDLYLQGSDSIRQGLALFDLERANFEHGQKWASENAKNDDAAQVCNDYPNAGAYVIQLRLHPRDQIRWMEEALNAARQLKNRQYEGVHLGNLGSAYFLLGETRKAMEFYEQGLKIQREIGNKRAEGAILGNLGIAYAALGETRKAMEFYEQDLTIAREIKNRRGEGNALMNTGNAYYSLGDARKAIEYHEQALPVFRAIGDRHGEGNDLWNMSLALDKLDERAKAIPLAEDALKILDALEDPNAGKVRKKLEEWRSSSTDK